MQGGGGEQPEAVPRSSSQPCIAFPALGCAVVCSSPWCRGTIELHGEGVGGSGCSPPIRLIFWNCKVMVCAHRSEQCVPFVLLNAQAGPKHGLLPTPGWSPLTECQKDARSPMGPRCPAVCTNGTDAVGGMKHVFSSQTCPSPSYAPLLRNKWLFRS